MMLDKIFVVLCYVIRERLIDPYQQEGLGNTYLVDVLYTVCACIHMLNALTSCTKRHYMGHKIQQEQIWVNIKTSINDASLVRLYTKN